MLTSPYPLKRMRRLRKNAFSRSLVKEVSWRASDLILPVFITDYDTVPIASMPGVYRQSLTDLLHTAEQCLTHHIPAIALFPVIDDSLKTADGAAALDPNNLLVRAVTLLKKHYPELGIITDVALDPYTSHGQDGIMDDTGYIVNDATVCQLVEMALLHAEAGADIVAPSDMMDGRVISIRQKLEEKGHLNTAIMAYSAKFASAFYGPFRDAVGSAANLGKGQKTTYQIDPANHSEALNEVALDISEGADIVMVKPGMPYLDILWRSKKQFNVPTAVYHVSGEYAMIKAAAEKGYLNEAAAIDETFTAFKRAGADAILSYFALDAVKLITR